MKRAFTIIEVLVVAAIVAIFASMIYAGYSERVQMPESYRAWEKQTGNPNHLTYQEWRALIRAYRHSSEDSTVYVPMPQ